MAKKLTFEDIQSVIAPQPKQAGASSIDDILGKYGDSSMDDILGKFQTNEKIDQVTNYPSLENYGKLNVSKYNPNYVPEEKKNLGFFKGVGSSFAAGSAELGQGAARIPSLLYETAAMPQNLLADVTGWKWLEAKSPEWLKNNPVAKYYDKQVQSWDESLAASDMKIIENFQSGNLREGFENIAYMTARTIPLTISLMAGGYASAGSAGGNLIKEGLKTAIPIGAYSAAQKKQQLDTQPKTETTSEFISPSGTYKEVQKKLPELSEFTKTFNALMTGVGEGLSETLGTVNVGRLGRELMESMGKETFKKVAKDNIIQTLYKRLNNSYLLTGAVSEGIEEVVAGVMENLTDRYTGVDPDRKLLEGTGDQFIVGLFAGGLTTTPFSLANKVAKKVEEREYVKQVNTYADLLTEQVTNKQTGEIVIAQNGKGEQFHIIDNAGDDVLVVANKQTGEISMMSEKEVQVTESLKPEDFRQSIVDQAMNKVTEENVEQATDELIEEEQIKAGEIAYKQGDVVDFQGKAFVVDQVNPDGIVAHPMDGDPLIDGIEITTEELAMPYDPETGQAKPEDIPAEKTFQFGKEQVKYFEKEDGSSFIPIEEGMDPNKLMKVINSEVDLTQFDVIPITEEIPIEGAPTWAKKKSEVVTTGISITPKGMVQTTEAEVESEIKQEPKKEITSVDSAIAVFRDSQSLEDFKNQVSPEEYSAFEQRFNPGKGLTEQQTYEKAVDELMGDKAEQPSVEAEKQPETVVAPEGKKKEFTNVDAALNAAIKAAKEGDSKRMNSIISEWKDQLTKDDVDEIKGNLKEVKEDKKPVVKESLTVEKKPEVKQKKKRGVPKRIQKVLSNDPQSIREAILHYFINGGRVSREAFARGLQGKTKELNAKGMLFLKKGGRPIDTLYEEFQNTFGAENLPGFDFPQMVIDVINQHTSVWSMVSEVEKLQQGEAKSNVPQEYLDGAEAELESNVVDKEMQEWVDYMREVPELAKAIDEFYDQDNNINWDAVKEKYETDKGFFTGFPFDLTEAELIELENLINNESKREIFTRGIKKGEKLNELLEDNQQDQVRRDEAEPEVTPESPPSTPEAPVKPEDESISEKLSKKIAGKELSAKRQEEFYRLIRDNSLKISKMSIQELNDWIVNTDIEYYEAQIKPTEKIKQGGINDELQKIKDIADKFNRSIKQEAKKEEKPAKEAWEMTRDEFYEDTKNNLIHPATGRPYKKGELPKWFTKARQDALHSEVIKQALSEGKPVPEEVLKDYPELIKPDKTEVDKKETKFAEDLLKPETKAEVKAEKPTSSVSQFRTILEQEQKLSKTDSRIKELKANKSKTPAEKTELTQLEILSESQKRKLDDLKSKFTDDLTETQKSDVRKALANYQAEKEKLTTRLETLRSQRRSKEKELQARNELTGDRKAEEDKKAGLQDMFAQQALFKPTNKNLQAALKPFNEDIARTEKELKDLDSLFEKQLESIGKGEQGKMEFGGKETKPEQPEKPIEKIEDVGEKIEGARKDQIKKYFDKINLNGRTLSTIFPRPDVKALLESGLSVKDVSGIKVAYEFASQDKKRGEAVIKFYASYAKNILAESINLEYKNEGWAFTDFGKSQVELRTQAYQKVVEVLGVEYLNLDLSKARIKEMTEAETKYMVKKQTGKYAVQYYVNSSKYFETLNEALNEFVEQIKANTTTETVEYKKKLNIYQDRTTGEYMIAFPQKGKPLVKLKEGFKTAKEAFAYTKDSQNVADLHLMLDRILAEQKVEKKDSKPRMKFTNETSRERVGKDWRNGRDISAQELADTFGFRAIEFGNWVNQKERQVFVNNTYDSFMDLAQLLNIPPKAISLSGNLGITFGSRGAGQAAAHFEPERRIINLTKTKGLGSLAHEWWHAIDNYFTDFKTGSANMKAASALEFKSDVRPEMKDAFKVLYEAINKGEYKARSKRIDDSRNKNYFSLMHEMSSRAFENFVLNRLAESGQINDFIVNYVSNDDWNGDVNNYPFPIGEESIRINSAFDNLFDVIESRQEGDNVVLFKHSSISEGIDSRSQLGLYSTVQRAINSLKQAKGTPAQMKAMLLAGGAKQAELDWYEWDNFSQDKKSLTKDEIQDWFDGRKIEVREVILSDVSEDDIDTFLEDEAGEGMTRDEAREYLQNDEGQSKFSQYQLPGGENYREILLTMPPKIFAKEKLDDLRALWGDAPMPQDEYQREYVDKNFTENTFQSSHFEEPNIVVHVRMNDRLTKDGKKILFLEEVQSDFSQSLRKKQDEYQNLLKNNPDLLIDMYKKSNKLEVLC